MTPQRMMERLFPEGHTYKVAFYPEGSCNSIATHRKASGLAPATPLAGNLLSGYRIETDGEEAVLHFNNVDWWNADIKVRTVLIYDADTRDAINITHLERTAGVYGGFFEYKMPTRASFDWVKEKHT